MQKEATIQPRKRRSGWRIFRRLVLIVFGFVGLVFLGLYLYMRDSLPAREGSLQVFGLTAAIEIKRDQYGIPHIQAENELDAVFGLGYVHAQDRLWQMEFQRRIARGTLSEAVGEAGIETDRFLRTLGIYRAAQSAYDNLDADSRAWIDAYVTGINAFLVANTGSNLPPEFLLVGVRPDAWVGADVLGWSKMMAWDLSGNYSYELLRTDLIDHLGLEKASELFPGYPMEAVTITGHHDVLDRLYTASLDVQNSLGMGGGIVDGVGSNNWVLAPERSSTGQPLLANDPHLSLKTPAIWYMASIQGGDLNVAGGTVPGLPSVLSGHNQSIAWGVTNLGPDVQDLYLERLDASGTQVEYAGDWEPLEIITETITVKDVGQILWPVRISRHGPLISDAINAEREPEEPALEAVAFRWTSLDETDSTMSAYRKLNLANSWDEFTNALSDYVAPAQNFVYADIEGNIGYYAPGRIPVRGQGEGILPLPGWDAAAEWQGYIPFEDLPHTFNPEAGFIASANNRAVPQDYPYLLANDWAAPFRAERITNLLQAQPQHSLQELGRIQADQFSPYAAQALPLLLAQFQPSNDREREVLALLENWDYITSRDSTATTIFEVWNYYLLPAILGDELGAELIERYGGRRSYVDLYMLEVLRNPESPWCDVISTPESETCAEQYGTALFVALQDLQQRYETEDISQWAWGELHLAFFPHQPLDGIRFFQGFFSKAIPNGGDGSSVNVAPIDFDAPYAQTHGPALRMLVDVGNWDNSQIMITPGQSGHFLSPHYDDLMEGWQAVNYVPLHFSASAIDGAAVATLRLEPAEGRGQ